MNSSDSYILNSDELRSLTKCGSGYAQIKFLTANEIQFELDEFGCPLVKRLEAENYHSRIKHGASS
jgi:hypothetical protein